MVTERNRDRGKKETRRGGGFLQSACSVSIFAGEAERCHQASDKVSIAQFVSCVKGTIPLFLRNAVFAGCLVKRVAIKHVTENPSAQRLKTSLKKAGLWDDFRRFTAAFDAYDHAQAWGNNPDGKGAGRNSRQRTHDFLAQLPVIARNNKNLPAGKKQKLTKFIRVMNPTALLKHAVGESKNYFVASNGQSRSVHAFVFDVDTKNSAEADLARSIIEAEVNGNFEIVWQRSTSGNGLHGWLWVRTKRSTTQYRAWASSTVARINAAVKARACKAKVEVKGLPPICNGHGTRRRYERMGTLIRAPKFSTVEGFARLSNAFNHPVGRSKLDRLFKTQSADETFESYGIRVDEAFGHASAKSRTDDAFSNMTRAMFYDRRILGNRATQDSGLARYESMGFATGPTTADRLGRAKRCYEFVRTHFNPNRREGSASAYFFREADQDHCIDFLRNYAASHRIDLSEKDLADCAAVMLVIWKCGNENCGEAPYKAIENFFRAAGCSISKGRIGKYRKLLIDAGVITVMQGHEKPTWLNGKRIDGRATTYEWTYCFRLPCESDETMGFSFEEIEKPTDVRLQRLEDIRLGHAVIEKAQSALEMGDPRPMIIRRMPDGRYREAS